MKYLGNIYGISEKYINYLESIADKDLSDVCGIVIKREDDFDTKLACWIEGCGVKTCGVKVW